MAGATAGRSAGAEGNKGRVEATKVKRYRPGQVPEWMKEKEEANEIPYTKPGSRSGVLDEELSVRRTGETHDLLTRPHPRVAFADIYIIMRGQASCTFPFCHCFYCLHNAFFLHTVSLLMQTNHP